MAVKPNIVVLFYAIANSENLSQRQLRDEWMLPLSTINTITTEFRNAGYITLEPIPGKSPGAFAPEKPAARYRLRPGYPQPAL